MSEAYSSEEFLISVVTRLLPERGNGAIGAASALVLPGGAASRPRAVALAGAGALVGALVGGWAPGLA